MFRTTRYASILTLALAFVSCDMLEVSESKQGPSWEEVLDVTAPHLMNEFDSAEVHLDPGVAPVGSFDEPGSVSDDERQERERVAREAGFDVGSWKQDIDCLEAAAGEVPPIDCDQVPARIVVAYSEPELKDPADEHWAVQAWVLERGTTNIVYFTLNRNTGGWAVANMTTMGPLDIY